MTTFERLGQLRRPEAFASWLFRTTANLAKNEIRLQSARQFDALDDATLSDEPRGEQQTVRRSQREAMRRALAQLPPKQRQCVLLRIDAELSFREIGEAVGTSEGGARVNFHHGLKRLRALLNPSEGGDPRESPKVAGKPK